jgi:phosphate transport system substrate-binding protein
MKKLKLSLAALACAALAACSGQSNQNAQPTGVARNGAGALNVVGAGSSFDYPFFSRAFYDYQKLHPEVSVNYQSIGSGGGIRQFTARTVDFAATDVPMSAAELRALPSGPGGAIQIPITLGGVVLAYNVGQASGNLKLSSAVIAGICLGKIRDWSDPAIGKLNPAAGLKSLPIVLVHRADGSGTTYIFSDYLASVSPEWNRRVGKGKSVNWPAPAALGAKGNEGVAGQIRNTPGAVGYIELAYALQNDMTFAAVQNGAGNFVLPSPQSVAAAAANKPAVSATSFSIVNAAGRDSYPIAGYSWVVLSRHYTDARKNAALRALFGWMLGEGQARAQTLNYTALPPAVAENARRQLMNVR